MGIRLSGQPGSKDEDEKLPVDSIEAAGGGQQNKQIKPLSAGESAFTSSSTGAPKVTKAPAIKGSGFTNIQKILSATGTQSGPSRLASTVAGGTRTAAQEAQSGLQTAQGDFGKKLENTLTGIETGKTTASGLITKAESGGTLTPAEVSSYSGPASGVYSGPTTLDLTGTQRRKAAEVSALSRLAGDVSGRSSLLQKYVGSPQYSLGKQRMDALLLGRGGSSAIRSALREGSRVEQETERGMRVAEEQAKQAQSRAAGIGEELKTQLGQATTGLTGELEETKQTEVNRISGAVDRVLGFFNNPDLEGAVSRRDLRILGLTENDIQNLRAAKTLGLDVNSYLTGRTGQQINEYLQTLGKEQFATEQQRAKLSGLGKLANVENLGLSNLGSAYNLQDLSSFDSQLLRSNFIDKLKPFVAVDKYKYDIGTRNVQTATDHVNQAINDYISGNITQSDLIVNDPVYKLAKQQVEQLEDKKDTVGTSGLYESGLRHWREVLANRTSDLFKVFGNVRKFNFVD